MARQLALTARVRAIAFPGAFAQAYKELSKTKPSAAVEDAVRNAQRTQFLNEMREAQFWMVEMNRVYPPIAGL